MHGIIGFLKILEHANDDFTIKGENYIEFETNKLINFSEYYFKYFTDKYNIANKVKERIEGPINKIKLYLIEQDTEESNTKEIKEKIQTQKKYVKVIIKAQMDKIKKFDEMVYAKILEEYKKIDSIKKKDDVEELERIKHLILNELFNEDINYKLTLNLFKSVLSKNYFGQPSFLNVSFTNLSYDDQKKLMYKDYISNIIETDFLRQILDGKCDLNDVNDHIVLVQKEHLIKTEIEKVYNNIYKLIEKGKALEEIKKYISEKVFSECCMCESINVTTEDFSEKHFAPLAISSSNMKNFFWNQNVTFPICDMCKIILFCTPAGMNDINKIVKEYKNGKKQYLKKEILNFVNYDTTVNELLKVNKDFSNRMENGKEIENPYTGLILDIVEQNKKITDWQLNNIFVVEFESEYGAFSRIEYFNIPKYVAIFLKEYSNLNLNKILDRKFKLEIADFILKNKDLSFVINNRLYDELCKEYKNGYYIFLTTKIRLILNLLKKEDFILEEKIKKENAKLNVLYNLGIQIHEELKQKKEENKLDSYEYKMLNSLKSGNKQEFIDIVIRIHMSLGKDVSPIFLEVMQEGNLDFTSIGHSFIAGLISNKYEKKVEVSNNG